MPKIALALAAGAALFAAIPTASPAHADSLACQTVNGRTTCLRGNGTLACETVNGQTRCSARPDATVPGVEPPATTASPPLPPDVRELLERQGIFLGGQGYTLRLRTDDLDLDMK